MTGGIATPLTLAERLSDAPRSGAPGKFSPEQICAIVALACKDPQSLDVPISHWSQSEVARQAVKRGFVFSISKETTSVGGADRAAIRRLMAVGPACWSLVGKEHQAASARG